MLQGELTTRVNLIGELTGGIFYGTNDYSDLINKPQINGVTLSGNKTTSDLGIIIPTKTSDLDNDSGFLNSSDVAPVAISGSYDDLTDKPTITPQVNSDWTAVSGVAEILNKPTIPTATSQLTNDSGFVEYSNLASVATTGAYADLIGIPTIPAPQVNSDWNAVSGVAEILNKPTIPTATSDLTNDSGFISYTDVTGTLTAGNTSITLSDSAILTTSTLDVYTDQYGLNPDTITVSTGSVTLTFESQASDVSIKVRVS
jgi:hypothetical protein